MSKKGKPPKSPTLREQADKLDGLRECVKQQCYSRERNDKAYRARLELYCADILDKRIHKITRAEVLDILEPIWQEKNKTAKLVRSQLRRIIGSAMPRYEAIVSNPAGEALDEYLSSITPRNVETNHQAADWRQAPALFAKLGEDRAENMPGPKSTGYRECLRFLMLTAVRSGEARGARWGEFDFDANVWTVPAERMKVKREHRVPLSRQAAELAQSRKLKAFALRPEGVPTTEALMFTGVKADGRTMFNSSSMNRTLRMLTANTELETTVHGLRSMFRSWAMENGYGWEASEYALAHKVGSNIEARYIRTDLLDERRQMMQDWADFVTGEVQQ